MITNDKELLFLQIETQIVLALSNYVAAGVLPAMIHKELMGVIKKVLNDENDTASA
jgi:hypothetical protein